MSNNLISQAGQMQLTGIPNDAIQILNPVACIIIGPCIQSLLYPTLTRYRISFGPIARMATALMTMAAGMAYAAGVQKVIYDQGPCYDTPLKCPAARIDSTKAPEPNHVKVWIQAPIYVIIAISEILGFTTLSEYSYSKAPRHMKTVVQAMRQVTAGVAYALGMGLSPLSKDPQVLWMYVGLAVTLTITGVAFWMIMGLYDRVDENLNTANVKEEKSEQKHEPVIEERGRLKEEEEVEGRREMEPAQVS